MARHASGKNNYALSGGVIAALVVALAGRPQIGGRPTPLPPNRASPGFS